MWLDAAGTAHAAVDPAAPVRIVSLVPSITELLCELGLAAQLVGRTGFCIHPAASVAGIPKIGGTKDVNIEKIRALAPTHLVVNIDENEKPTVDALAAFIPQIIVTHPVAPIDNLALYRLLGGIFSGIFGVQARAHTLCAEFERAMNALQPGQVSEPVESQFGYHLIEVIERKTEEVSRERQRLIARQAMRDRKLEEAYEDWLRQLRDRAYVEYRLDEVTPRP